jgi:hypothetical protein
VRRNPSRTSAGAGTSRASTPAALYGNSPDERRVNMKTNMEEIKKALEDALECIEWHVSQDAELSECAESEVYGYEECEAIRKILEMCDSNA